MDHRCDRAGRLRRDLLLAGAGWGCKVAAAHFFLEAFHIGATLENALLVRAAAGLSTLVPATPGGIGPTQDLPFVPLAGAGSSRLFSPSASAAISP